MDEMKKPTPAANEMPVEDYKPLPEKYITRSFVVSKADIDLLQDYYGHVGLSKPVRKLIRRLADRVRLERGLPAKGTKYLR